jgi:hypothetical protein
LLNFTGPFPIRVNGSLLQKEDLIFMNREQKIEFLRQVDLQKTKFQIKIADFGFSKKLISKT